MLGMLSMIANDVNLKCHLCPCIDKTLHGQNAEHNLTFEMKLQPTSLDFGRPINTQNLIPRVTAAFCSRVRNYRVSHGIGPTLFFAILSVSTLPKYKNLVSVKKFRKFAIR